MLHCQDPWDKPWHATSSSCTNSICQSCISSESCARNVEIMDLFNDVCRFVCAVWQHDNMAVIKLIIPYIYSIALSWAEHMVFVIWHLWQDLLSRRWWQLMSKCQFYLQIISYFYQISYLTFLTHQELNVTVFPLHFHNSKMPDECEVSYDLGQYHKSAIKKKDSINCLHQAFSWINGYVSHKT